MRPSQVTHQGRLYYHCAFTAPAKHPLEMHTYICSRYLYMYACSWVCHSEWEVVGMLGHAWSGCCVCVRQTAWVCVWSSAVQCVTHFVQSTCAAIGLRKQKHHLTCFRKDDCNLQLLLVLLQDAQLYPSVVTDSVLISWSSWLWPWTSPTRCTWWLMGSSEPKSGLVLRSFVILFFCMTLHAMSHIQYVTLNLFYFTPLTVVTSLTIQKQ